VSELGSYPRLATDLADEDSQKKFEPNKFHVSLGPNSSYYFNNTAFGQNADKLDVKLDRHLTSRLTSDGHWDRDPIHVTLGCDGSYVSVGRDGDLLWDLKGGYASLETILQEATTGVGNVTLSPFHNDRYYIIFKDGREYWHEPSS
jgi:hypothetical protein